MSFGTKVGDVLVGTGALVVKASIKVGYKTGGFLGDVVDGGTVRYAVEEVKIAALINQLDAEAATRAAQREAAKAQALANYHAAEAAKQQPLAPMAQTVDTDKAEAQAMIGQLQALMAQAAALQAATAK